MIIKPTATVTVTVTVTSHPELPGPDKLTTTFVAAAWARRRDGDSGAHESSVRLPSSRRHLFTALATSSESTVHVENHKTPASQAAARHADRDPVSRPLLRFTLSSNPALGASTR
ncbi:hypothetical protein FZEAL_9319 [Fusarium zealandicum]|uniref:Uncharacterized protein n=1 Tax=Fusarium zealandicum TaxID=1053134 RepID=A0A8H4UC07_9HYPO|nr:hypothetical protein FZEAL_9319 [Fusarium zealandicum]